MASSHAGRKRYEGVLRRYFRIPASERRTGDRERVLKALGIGNPREFLGMHIPLWEARVDELLDPSTTDMLPASLSHNYVSWVRDVLRTLPAGARVMILSSKLAATGLAEAVLALLRAHSGKAYRDFEVEDVRLLQEFHKDTLFTVRTRDRREHSVYLSHSGCQGEFIYSGLPGLVGLPALPVAYHVTPQGEEALLKPAVRGIDLLLDPSAAEILRGGAWWVEGVARQDALGDCVGTVLRRGHYLATPKKEVVMVDMTELFHPGAPSARRADPVREFLPGNALPGDARKREKLRREMREAYRRAYADQMGTIRARWAEIARYLDGLQRIVRTYTGEPHEIVVGRVKARVFGRARRERRPPAQ